MTGLWENIAAFVVAPIALWIIAVGHGLLIERLTGLRLPNPLVVAVGLCGAFVVSLAAYEIGAGDAVAVPVVVALAAIGVLIAWRELPGRLNAGWPLVAALATFVLFDLSVIATGHWAWTGYNLTNDSAYELVLVSHLQAHGTVATTGPVSTTQTVVSQYLATGYPLGSLSMLGVLSGLLGVSAAALWQGFISALAALGALAASCLSGRTFSPRLAALVAFISLGSALFYQYALQGSIKEVAVLAAVLCALAVGRYAIVSLGGVRAPVLVVLPLAAVLAVYSAAGLPYVGALAGVGLLVMLVVRRQWPRPQWVKPAAAGVLALAVFSIPALLTIGTFFNVASGGFNASHPAAPVLGPLLRPLPLSEISGVWLYGDYRSPVPSGSAGTVTVIVTVMVFALVVPALWKLWKAQEPGPAIALGAMVLVLVVVFPRVVPYAQAKLLAIASPIVVLVALQGLSGFRSRAVSLVAILVGVVIGGTVLASDSLAYHDFPVAPVNRLVALRQVGQRLGPRGPVLDSEFEQFAKYFMLPARVIDGPDAPTPIQLELRVPAPEYDRSFDLNQETLYFIESFPYVLTRRSPVSSRPPANYRLLFENAFYELWARQSLPHVYEHVPTGGQRVVANARPRCSVLRSVVSHAPAGTRLVAWSLPTVAGYQPMSASSRSPGWLPSGSIPGGVVTLTPGKAAKTVDLATAGPYRIWLQGDFPRTVSVTLDGRTIGSVKGTDSPGGWLSAGVATLPAGSHLLGIRRGGAGPAPGDGNTQAEIDAVALVDARQRPRFIAVPVARWRSLCSVAANWIELIGAGSLGDSAGSPVGSG
ncbi:MAG TPA: hypothetical protein VKR21_09295 [Solirubrobacteraceae bacterium]|nr:hypothetical protein [Solirubrobacteraceae bacterium]